MEVRIPHYNLEPLKRKINKVNKSLEKLGQEQLEVSIEEDGREDFGNAVTKFYKVKIKGEVPVFDGWSVLAKVTHFKEEKDADCTDLLLDDEILENFESGTKRTHNIVESFVKRNLQDKNWWFAKPVCEHCNQNRYRKTSFIIKKGDKQMQLGSSCVKDFLDFNTAKAIMKFYSTFKSLKTNAKKALNKKPMLKYSERYVDLTKFLAVCRQNNRYYNGIYYVLSMLEGKIVEPSPEAWDYAKKAIEYVKGLDPNENNYQIENLQSIIHAGVVGDNKKSKERYYATKILYHYKVHLRYEEQQKELEEKNIPKESNEHFGNKGDAVNVKAQFLKCTEFGTWGTCHAVECITEQGHIIVFFTKDHIDKKMGKEVEVGEHFNVKGIIKYHREWSKIKQTVLWRIHVEL